MFCSFRTSHHCLTTVTRRWLSNNNLISRSGLTLDPSHAAIIDGGRTFTYGELNEEIGKVSRVLTEKYNLKKGDRLLARTNKSVHSLFLYLGALRIGVIYVPLNPSYTAEETEHFVKDAQPKLFVTSTLMVDGKRFREEVSYVVDEGSIRRDRETIGAGMKEIEHVLNDDIACICYTSGTTGAMITHGGLSFNAQTLVDCWKFTPNDKLFHSLPFYHVHGMFISLNCSLFSHSTVLWKERFTVEDTVSSLRDATVMMGVPTFYSRLVNCPSFTRECIPPQMRLFVSGSAPLSPALWQEFKHKTGHTILERYGMTEAQVISSNPFDGQRVCGSVGTALNGTQIRINENGIIEMKSDAVFKGYWRNEKKTKEEFTEDGWFITGDVGKMDQKGYVYILGRGKDLIISGGLNVYPKQVEDVVDHLDGVAESAVIGVPHSDLGEAVVVVVAMKKDKILTEDEVILKMKDKLAGYKIPKRVVFVESLPRNSMAKIQKNVLRDRYRGVLV